MGLGTFSRYTDEEREKILQFTGSKVADLLVRLDPSYRVSLLHDYRFLCDRAGAVLKMLRNHDILSIDEIAGEEKITVRLRRGRSQYKVPQLIPLRDVV
jgi:hypothetical protein